MADQQPETTNGAAATNSPAGAQFSVDKIYVKDVSFESPKAPQVFNEQAQPQLNMNLNQRVTKVGENSYEVVLGVTLTCTLGEGENNTVYVAEVQQAGMFSLSGFEPQVLDAMLGTHCPNALYPYVRQLISELIQCGGFPPFLLQPINFESLYAEGLRQRAAEQQKSEGSGSETAGNA